MTCTEVLRDIGIGQRQIAGRGRNLITDDRDSTVMQRCVLLEDVDQQCRRHDTVDTDTGLFDFLQWLILLDHDEVYLLKEETGAPIQLKWVISPVDADDPTVRFESDNEQVAQVTKDGLVSMTGGYGTAVITAYSDSGASAQFIVNVVTQLPEEAPEPTEIPVEGAYADYNAEDGEFYGEDLYGDDEFSESDLYEDNIYGETPPPGGEAP